MSAAMSLAGVASASNAAPAFLTASGVEGQRTGIIFVGYQQQTEPWAATGTSFLYFSPPLGSGGTDSPRDGVLSAAINAYLAANSGTLLGQPDVAGLACNAQCWFRDPPARRERTSVTA